MGSIREENMLVENTTIAPGPWIDVGYLESAVLHVEGIVAGDIVQVFGSNDDGIATAITNEDQLGDDITADDIVALDALPKWIRVKRSDITGAGTVNVRMIGRR